MQFSVALIAAFAALAIAAPTGTPLAKRAAVLSTKTYDEYILLIISSFKLVS